MMNQEIKVIQDNKDEFHIESWNDGKLSIKFDSMKISYFDCFYFGQYNKIDVRFLIDIIDMFVGRINNLIKKYND